MKNTPVALYKSALLALPLFGVICSPAYLQADTITSFAALEALTPTITYVESDTFSSPPAGISDTSDFTFRFDLTTPTDVAGDHVVLDFGGGFGTSVILEDDRLVFRVGSTTGLMYVASNALSVSTTYDVTGSIFLNASGVDSIRFYLNEADGVDTGLAFHSPSEDIGSDWTGGNAGAYGKINSDVQVGTVSAAGSGFVGANFDTTDGSLGTLSLYNNTYLNVVPEPSAFGLLAGLFAFSWVAVRRRG